jgi:hypothetical protein
MAAPTPQPAEAQPTWAESASGSSNIDEPGAPKKAGGWLYQEVPPRNWFNWLLRNFGRWDRWNTTRLAEIAEEGDAQRGSELVGGSAAVIAPNSPHNISVTSGTMREQVIEQATQLAEHVNGTESRHTAGMVDFDGTGTNYLTAATEVNTALDTLDTSLNNEADARATVASDLEDHADGTDTAVYEVLILPQEATVTTGTVTMRSEGASAPTLNNPAEPGYLDNTVDGTVRIVYPIHVPVGAIINWWKLYGAIRDTGSSEIYRMGLYELDIADAPGTAGSAVGTTIDNYNLPSTRTWPGNLKVNSVGTPDPSYVGPFTDDTVATVSAGSRTKTTTNRFVLIVSGTFAATSGSTYTAFGPLLVNYTKPLHA